MTELFDPAALVDAADDPGRHVERYRFSGLLVGALVTVFVGSIGLTLRRGAPRPRGIPTPGTARAVVHKVRQ